MTVIKSDNLLKTIPFVEVCHYGAPDMPLIMQQPALQFLHILLKKPPFETLYNLALALPFLA